MIDKLIDLIGWILAVTIIVCGSILFYFILPVSIINCLVHIIGGN